ncbi:SGNH/GDSL hydrolase family protein [Methylocella sp.]|uniref:SGNH/GDSL hydrolase family protein n=1 Tax=Methylocella sp. TaxID=1978226 RepID=UPI003C28D59E
MRLAALPVLAGLIAWFEVRRQPASFRLLSFALVFLTAADLASLLRGAARDCLLVAASLIFGLFAIEAAAYVMKPGQIIVSSDGETVRRPVIGWGPERAGRFHSQKSDPKTGALIYSADYTIDSNLLRETHSADVKSTIAFFGDSITFGVGLNDADTLPQQFADLEPEERVINLAFTGYGPQHFLREMETGLFDSVIGPQPRLFVFLTTPWHAERTSCKASWVVSAPRYVLDNGEPVFKGSCYKGAALQLQQFLWNSAAYHLVFDPDRQKANHDDIELYIRILLAAVDLAKTKYGVPTLIPFLRSSDEYLRGTGFTNDEITARLAAGGAHVVDVSLLREESAGAKISIPGDGHPTALANRLRAEMLRAYISHDLAYTLRVPTADAVSARQN